MKATSLLYNAIKNINKLQTEFKELVKENAIELAKTLRNIN